MARNGAFAADDGLKNYFHYSRADSMETRTEKQSSFGLQMNRANDDNQIFIMTTDSALHTLSSEPTPTKSCWRHIEFYENGENGE